MPHLRNVIFSPFCSFQGVVYSIILSWTRVKFNMANPQLILADELKLDATRTEIPRRGENKITRANGRGRDR